MKCRRNLNDALQKGFFRLRFAKPDFFPRFVGFEETSGIEVRNAHLEFFIVLRGFHRDLD